MGKHKRHDHRHYSKRQIKEIRAVYLGAGAAWIASCYLLRAYKTPSIFGLVLLTIPPILYGIAYANIGKVTRDVEKRSIASNLLVFGTVFVTILFEVSHRKKHTYTIHIMLSALILIVFGGADIWTGKRAMAAVHHAKSAARTAALTLFIFVISVHIIDHIPINGEKTDERESIS